MDSEEIDEGVVIFETRMGIKAYVNMQDGITIEQAEPMGNEPALISFGCDDVERLVKALRSLKKQIRQQAIT